MSLSKASLKKLLILSFTITALLVGCNGKDNNENNDEMIIPEGYELYWNDEFDGDELNLEYWNYMYGDGSMYGNPGWGNQEAQYYQEENVSVEDGKLVITARKESVGNYEYTSARLSTKDKVAIKYGRIEASISLPEVEGMWPAFWMLPESDTPYGEWPTSGEIDIMEARGRVNDMTSAALHYNSSSGGHTYQTKTKIFRDDTISSYHVYALEWTEYKMTWYVDDEEFFSIDNDPSKPGQKWYSAADPTSYTAPFDHEFHILLNMAVGGHFDDFTLPPNDFAEAQMKVDYVRIFKEI
ncbi:MAG: glycoside hydrolase family 16 protein [Acholeplasmatales bacterium]|nr:glycoside hydrolase family 16 protein [Acholeplasmatales bacterium]